MKRGVGGAQRRANRGAAEIGLTAGFVGRRAELWSYASAHAHLLGKKSETSGLRGEMGGKGEPPYPLVFDEKNVSSSHDEPTPSSYGPLLLSAECGPAPARNP